MEKIFLSVKESDITSRFLTYVFYFSSEARKRRFERKLKPYINEEILKFKNKYKLDVDEQTFSIMFSFILYSKCENRGFKIERIVSLDDKTPSQTFFELPKYSIYGYFDERR